MKLNPWATCGVAGAEGGGLVLVTWMSDAFMSQTACCLEPRRSKRRTSLARGQGISTAAPSNRPARRSASASLAWSNR